MRAQRIKERLLQRRQDVLSRYHDELDRTAEELDSREVEAVENATELWDARVLSVLGDADVEALTRIVAALRRLDEGCYGACVECGIAIEPARLAALPEAATCFDCALDAEERASARLAS
jgi:DnaK suppressor protein